MSETQDDRRSADRTEDRSIDEVQKRGGYLAPASPFSLPTMPAGPAQGAQPDPDPNAPAKPDPE